MPNLDEITQAYRRLVEDEIATLALKRATAHALVCQYGERIAQLEAIRSATSNVSAPVSLSGYVSRMIGIEGAPTDVPLRNRAPVVAPPTAEPSPKVPAPAVFVSVVSEVKPATALDPVSAPDQPKKALDGDEPLTTPVGTVTEPATNPTPTNEPNPIEGNLYASRAHFWNWHSTSN